MRSIALRGSRYDIERPSDGSLGPEQHPSPASTAPRDALEGLSMLFLEPFHTIGIAAVILEGNLFLQDTHNIARQKTNLANFGSIDLPVPK